MRLAEHEARRRLAQARVARLATMFADGRPHVVPITFAVDADLIYTAVDAKPKTTRDLQRLRNLAASPQTAVLADHYDESWSKLWWVRADGLAAIIGDPAEMAGPVGLLASRYPQYRESPPAGPVIAIRIQAWTGWSAS
jgi:PPOX class probable F420-dependent enzyme